MKTFFTSSVIFLCTLILNSSLLAREIEETFKKNVPAGSATLLSVENRNGSIEISTWDKDEIGITAYKKVRADGRDQAAELMEQLKIVIETHNDEIEVYTEFPDKRNGKNRSSGFFSWLLGDSWNVSYSVSYEIKVPQKFDVNARSTNGRVEAVDCNGRIRLETTNGKIVANNISGSMRCNTTNGSINASLVSVIKNEEMNFSSTNGSITLYLPEDIDADIKARTTNGSIHCDLNVTEQLSHSKKSFDAVVNNGGIYIYLKTTNGSINIRES
jgi:Toastrack DUF4097